MAGIFTKRIWQPYLHCRASFTTFGFTASGSGALSNVHHSRILVINMDVVRGHMSYAHAPPNKKNIL